MAEHTPGPWRYVRNGDYWMILPCEINGKDNMDGNEADYHLIAAAPELLAALLMLNRFCVRPGDDGPYDDGYDEARRLAEAAIKKARGEA